MYELVDQGLGTREAFARAQSRIAAAPAWAASRLAGASSEPESAYALGDRGHREQLSQFREAHVPPYAWVVRHLLQKGQVGAARRILEVALAASPNLESLQSLTRALRPPTAEASSPPPLRQQTALGHVRRAAALHRGKWVAVLGTETVGVDDSLSRLLAGIAARPLPGSPIIHREPG